MVVIRLSRIGSRHQPRYRVVVADSRCSVTGRFIEIIGHYNALQKDKKAAFQLDLDAYKKWLSQGAKARQTVKNLVHKVYAFGKDTDKQYRKQAQKLEEK